MGRPRGLGKPGVARAGAGSARGSQRSHRRTAPVPSQRPTWCTERRLEGSEKHDTLLPPKPRQENAVDGEISNTPFILFCKCFYRFIHFLREREREHKRVGEEQRERGRHRI